MSEAGRLPCVLVDLYHCRLLLPNVAIAEVVRMQRVQRMKNAPDWFLGVTAWRGKILPVLSPEQILKEGLDSKIPPLSSRDSLLIMNRSRPLDGVEFYVLAVRAMPHMVRVAEEDLKVADTPPGEAEVARLKLGRTAAIIPQLAYFEDLVVENRLVPEMRNTSAS